MRYPSATLSQCVCVCDGVGSCIGVHSLRGGEISVAGQFGIQLLHLLIVLIFLNLEARVTKKGRGEGTIASRTQ